MKYNKLFTKVLSIMLFACMLCDNVLASDTFEEVLEKAKKGDATAQCELGNMYSTGNKVKQNYVEAAKWFRKSADQGIALAQHNLGIMHYNGLGLKKDLSKAAILFRKAAEQDFGAAQNNYGLMLKNGEGLTVDLIESSKWIIEAAENGIIESQILLGYSYAYGKDGFQKNREEAAKWFLKAAKQGDDKAQYIYSQWCLNKAFENMISSWEPDPAWIQESKFWVLKAAQQGLPQAQQNVCFGYSSEGMQVFGFQQDFNAAAYWGIKAAEQGCEFVCPTLAELYAEGKGVIQSNIEAYKWYDLAITTIKIPRKEYYIKRDSLALNMTDEEISKAKKLSDAWRIKFNKKIIPIDLSWLKK